jgi:hypothetical protein
LICLTVCAIDSVFVSHIDCIVTRLCLAISWC